ncbi:4125_t:CDS:1, partial [Dentiscutata erythropus]
SNCDARAFWELGALHKQPMVSKGSVIELVQGLLDRVELLIDSLISLVYKKRLEKAQGVFENFVAWAGFLPYPASRKLLVAFFAWLEVLGRITEMTICLAVVAKKYKFRNFENSIKEAWFI